MILVATAAIGMASMGPMWNQFQRFWAGIKTAPPWQAYAVMAHTGLTMALIMIGVGYVWIRLIPPRLPASDLIHQPGMLFFLVLIGLSSLLMAVSAFVPLGAWANSISALVLGLAWGAACRRYRSRAQPGWIEGLGRSFGVGLVVILASDYPLSLLLA